MDLNELLERTLAGLGYDMVDLELQRSGLIRIFIDKPGGIDIDDCTRVSNHVSRLLAVEMDYDYDRLEVSSPGLDRPLKKLKDYERFLGEKAQIKMRTAVAGQRNFVGMLSGVENGILQLDVEGVTVELELANVLRARLVPNI